MDTSTYSDPAQIVPRKAGMALAQGEIATYSTTDDNCTRAGAAPAKLMGVNRFTVASGQGADIAMGGVERVVIGAAVTRGDYLTSDASGRAIPITLNPAGATYIAQLGQAMESGAVAGEYVAVKINVCPVIIA